MDKLKTALLATLSISQLAIGAATPSAAEQPDARAADEATGYVGIGFGQADDEILMESGNAWKVDCGGWFSRHFGLEVGYVDLGAPTLHDPLSDFSIEFAQDAFYADAMARLTLARRLDLFAKFGWHAWHLNVDAGDAGTGEDNGSAVSYGAGVAVRVTRHFKLRGEFDRFTDVQESDVDLTSVGVVYSF